MPKKLRSADYRVAWIAPVSDLELLPSRLMLDEEHEPPDYNTKHDDNVYVYGAIGGHNVVIATCPKGLTGNFNAGRVAGPMFKTFSNLRMTLLVGVGGGVPLTQPPDDPTQDVHLGDVVVGWPGDGGPAYICYESIKFHLDRPDRVLLNGLAKLVSDHEIGRSTFQDHRKRLLESTHRRNFTFPGLDKDRLFQASHPHKGPNQNACAACDHSELVQRQARAEKDADRLIFHQGRIAVGHTAIQDGARRDQIREECDGALCIETEAAGIDASGRCLVIRGIADYADSHKNDTWRSYAAGNAAVFARELLSKIPPEKLNPPFLVPFQRNKLFIGREDILAQLQETIPPTASSDTCQRTVVEGLGGIGKTQVAIEASYRVRKAYPDCAVFWVPAVDKAMFENAYRDIGRALRIHGIDDDKADVKALVKSYLSREDVDPWLLILDNADDPALLFSDDQLVSHLPRSQNGSILLTTRNHQVAVRFEAREGILTLDPLDYLESMQLLHQDLQPGQINGPYNTAVLLQQLTYLPLAIRQASAFMAENSNVTILGYLEYFRSTEQEIVTVLSEDFKDQDRYKKIKNLVATTWLISFRHIKRDNELAAEYLGFCSYLAEKDIPVSLLPQPESKIKRDKAIGTLTAYAFIQQRTVTENASGRFDIHRLVSLAMRNWLREKGEEAEQVTRTISGLAQILPLPTHETRQAWAGYLPHTQAAVAFGGQCVDKSALWTVLHSIGMGNEIHGRYRDAEPFDSQAAKLALEVFGAEHPDTLSSMNNLASVLSRQGKYEQAETMHRQTVELTKKALGPEHPVTLTSMNNLALVLSSQGKYAEAETMHREELALCAQALGPEHPSTLTSMNNLAEVLSSQGKYAEAEAMHRQTVEQCKKALDPEHPDTLTSMNNLAEVLSSQGKYEEAETMHRQTVEQKKKVLGAGHPSTLTSMNNLASVLSRQGKYEEAETMYQQTVEQCKKALGAEHPSTLTSMNNLASVLSSQGKYAEAEAMHRQTLELSEKLLREKAPFTLHTMSNLAESLRQQRKYDEAVKLHQQTLERRGEVLGRQHPDTLASMNNLAETLRQHGKYEEAETMHRETLGRKKDALGGQHPSTLISINNLALVLQRLAKYEEAERMHRQTFESKKTTLGEHHPSTLTSMNNLATVLHKQGQYDEAGQLHRQVRKLYETKLGQHHPFTLGSMNNLAEVLRSRERYEDAEQLHRQTMVLYELALGPEYPATLKSSHNLASISARRRRNEA